MSFVPSFNEKLDSRKASQLNSLVLAYIGDAVQALYEKTKLATQTTLKVNDLTKEVTKKIRATSQAQLLDKVIDTFTEDEMAVFKRARNSHVNSVPKSSSLVEYKKSTALEAVIGYLYLSGQNDRIEEILKEED